MILAVEVVDVNQKSKGGDYIKRLSLGKRSGLVSWAELISAGQGVKS